MYAIMLLPISFKKLVPLRVLSISVLASVALGLAYYGYQPLSDWRKTTVVTDNPADWLGI